MVVPCEEKEKRMPEKKIKRKHKEATDSYPDFIGSFPEYLSSYVVLFVFCFSTGKAMLAINKGLQRSVFFSLLPLRSLPVFHFSMIDFCSCVASFSYLPHTLRVKNFIWSHHLSFDFHFIFTNCYQYSWIIFNHDTNNISNSFGISQISNRNENLHRYR